MEFHDHPRSPRSSSLSCLDRCNWHRRYPSQKHSWYDSSLTTTADSCHSMEAVGLREHSVDDDGQCERDEHEYTQRSLIQGCESSAPLEDMRHEPPRHSRFD